jgi:hypothetical protein
VKTKSVSRIDPSFRTVRVLPGALVYRHGRAWHPGETLRVHPGDMAHMIKRGTVEEVG